MLAVETTGLGWRGDSDPTVCGDDLRELTPVDIKALGGPALKLWCWLASTRGYASKPIQPKMLDVAAELAMPYRTLKRALARLRQCGAVETSQATRTRWWVSPRERWYTILDCRVWGWWAVRKQVLLINLPAKPFAAWVEKQGSWGGKRRGKRHQKRIENAFKLAPSSRKCDDAMDVKSGTYPHQVGPSIITHIRESETKIQTATPEAGAASVLSNFLPEAGEDQETQSLDALATRPAPKLVPRKSPYEIPRLSHPHRLLQGADMGIDRNMTDEAKVALLGQAYRRALKLHFGVESMTMRFGASTRSKHYPALRAVLPKMLELAVNPFKWADWYVETAKKTKWVRPPNITQVFSAGQLVKKAKWYQRAHEGAYGAKAVLSREHLEQVFRLREVHALNRGVPPDVAPHVGAPWYAEMRRAELKAGNLDPNDFYPQLPDDDTHAT